MINQKTIISFLKSNIEPFGDMYNKEAYRAAVHLIDGTYMPCVIFMNKKNISKLLLDRFTDLQDRNNFIDNNIVPSLFDGACTLQFVSVEKIEISKFAIPDKLRNILLSTGETGMSYTSFVGQMDDGQEFTFASQSDFAFLQMPAGYSAQRLTNVIPHKKTTGEVYLDMPYFHCFIDFEKS